MAMAWNVYNGGGMDAGVPGKISDFASRRGRWGRGRLPAAALCWLLFLACPALSAAKAPCSSAATNKGANAQASCEVSRAADGDDRSDIYDDPRRVFARIQSDLGRVAAGRPRWPVPSGVARNPMEEIVDAYSAFLNSDTQNMDAALSRAWSGVEAMRRRDDSMGPQHKNQPSPSPSWDYDTLLSRDAKSPDDLVRLFAGLRAVDSVLFLEATNAPQADPQNRDVQQPLSSMASPDANMWLRLPCRTINRRLNAFKQAAAELGQLEGPVLDCPSDDVADYDRMARVAANPRRFIAHQQRKDDCSRAPGGSCTTAGQPPTERDKALASMSTRPAFSARVLEKASHADGKGELDYALFLHAFGPKGKVRNAQVNKLLDDVIEKANPEPSRMKEFTPKAYDGSDESLINTIILASMGGDSSLSQYVIPCPVLVARPKLVEATEAQFAGHLDSFTPSSGCREAPGFPGKAVSAFLSDSTAADGNFIGSFSGSLVVTLSKGQQEQQAAMQVDPNSFLAQTPPQNDYPYQNWGYTSLSNYRVSMRLKGEYDTAYRDLAAYYRKKGLTLAHSNAAAKAALFASVFGSTCAGAAPENSVRRMLLEHAAIQKVTAALQAGDDDASLLQDCTRYAGMDPLIMVSVDYSSALALIVKKGADVDERNPIGKTALMLAAQFNALQSASLLISHGARVNATTWSNHDGIGDDALSHDGRTPLMYAAANGSLAMIELLLAHGADACQTDTKGYRAIDYLLGYGPSLPNKSLTGRERAMAIELLY
jgi:hypothetical protein